MAHQVRVANLGVPPANGDESAKTVEFLGVSPTEGFLYLPNPISTPRMNMWDDLIEDLSTEAVCLGELW